MSIASASHYIAQLSLNSLVEPPIEVLELVGCICRNHSQYRHGSYYQRSIITVFLCALVKMASRMEESMEQLRVKFLVFWWVLTIG